LNEKVARLDIARLKKGRKSRSSLKSVGNNTAVVRIKYVKGYLKWLAEYAYLQGLPSNRSMFKEAADMTVEAIGNRVPPSKKPNATSRRLGLTEADQARVLALAHPDNPSNPWKDDAFVRERNWLIVQFLLGMGVRKGEMLGVKVADFNTAENMVMIARRADDPEDTRKRQPLTKTCDRELKVGNQLADQLKRYLRVVRASAPAARKHPYIIVSETGEPLSLNSVDYMFSVLRLHLPGLGPLSAHVLRHTWNDRFSVWAEKHGLDPKEEEKVRNYIMGWSENSKQAANYTARYVQSQAHDALSNMQSTMYRGKK
jgi:integrase